MVQTVTTSLQKSANLSDLTDLAAARANLGVDSSGASSDVEVEQLDAVSYANTIVFSEMVDVTFPALTLDAGDVIVLKAFGTFLNNSGASRSLTPQLSFGGVTTSATASSFPASATAYSWDVDIRVVVTEANQYVVMDLAIDTPSGTKHWKGTQTFTAVLSSAIELGLLFKMGTAASTIVSTTTSGYYSIFKGEVVEPVAPLFFSDYDSVGSAGASNLTPMWQSEQQPSVGGVVQDRMTVVGHASVPGSGPFKPVGNAMRVELRQGDVQAGQYNRAEVYARHGDNADPASAWPDPPGSVRWYGFSVYVPDDFTPAPTGTVWCNISQFKGNDGGSPPVAVELKQANLRFGGTRTNSGLVPNDGQLTAYTAGAWHKIVIGMLYAVDSSTGWVEAWLNDAPWVPRQNLSTLDEITSGVPDRMYFKQGIYRSTAWTTTNVLYFSPTVIAARRVDVEAKLATVLQGS